MNREPIPFHRSRLVDLSLRLADLGKYAASYNYRLFRQGTSTPSRIFDALSPQGALRAAQHAYSRVPAYRRFLDQTGWQDSPELPVRDRLRRLPETDKEAYVKAFPTEKRCVDGRIPMNGTEIDESSGSSGTPFNWVRSRAELDELHRTMGQYGRLCYGDDFITINGFSMGAWATGVIVGEGLRRNGVVKSTGPDLEKILNTLEFFGPSYRYVITGYPPFLKHVVDESEASGFDWSRYTVSGLVGGEGMSEGLRAYLERRFESVYSCYGASDLDIGVGAEVPLSVWIRKQAAGTPELKAHLFGDDPRLPMLFQYNPLDYYIETNEQNELIVTVNRLKLLSPRIRYNIHDNGGVIPFDRMVSLVGEFGLDPLESSPKNGDAFFRLPFLYLFGRSDSTISYMGANIYPEDVQQALYKDSDDAGCLGSYCLELVDVGKGEQRPCVHVELLTGSPEDPSFSGRLQVRVVEGLMATNKDFRSSVSEDASAKELLVRLHARGEGPFAGNDARIKRRYIIQTTPSS